MFGTTASWSRFSILRFSARSLRRIVLFTRILLHESGVVPEFVCAKGFSGDFSLLISKSALVQGLVLAFRSSIRVLNNPRVATI